MRTPVVEAGVRWAMSTTLSVVTGPTAPRHRHAIHKLGTSVAQEWLA